MYGIITLIKKIRYKMNYEQRAKIYIKTQMAKADIDYPKLSELLKEKGINETRENLANKINRGKFSFAFAIAILDVLGVVIDK